MEPKYKRILRANCIKIYLNTSERRIHMIEIRKGIRLKGKNEDWRVINVSQNRVTVVDLTKVTDGKLTVKAVRTNSNGEVNAFSYNNAFKATGSAMTTLKTVLGDPLTETLNGVAGFARTGSYSVAVDVTYADSKEKTYSTSFNVKNSVILPTVSVSTTKVSSTDADTICSEALSTNVDLNCNESEYESIEDSCFIDATGKEAAPQGTNSNMIVKYVIVKDNYKDKSGNDITYNFLVPVGKTFVQK